MTEQINDDVKAIKQLYHGLSYREQMRLWREVRPTDWAAEIFQWTLILLVLGGTIFFTGPSWVPLVAKALKAWQEVLR